jgi:hypothetical protein
MEYIKGNLPLATVELWQLAGFMNAVNALARPRFVGRCFYNCGTVAATTTRNQPEGAFPHAWSRYPALNMDLWRAAPNCDMPSWQTTTPRPQTPPRSRPPDTSRLTASPHHSEMYRWPTRPATRPGSPGARNAPHQYARNPNASIVPIEGVKQTGRCSNPPLYT